MEVEILTPEQYGEMEEFVSRHPQGGFTQSVNWQKVKNNWGYEAVVSRGEDGEIEGAVSVLIQKIPLVRDRVFICAARAGLRPARQGGARRFEGGRRRAGEEIQRPYL